MALEVSWTRLKPRTPYPTLIILAGLLLAAAKAKPCPSQGFDPNCQYCDEQDKCMYCNVKYYLNTTSTTDQFCFACQPGCDKCFNQMYCTICQTEEYFLESSTCVKCMKGCRLCTELETCNECYGEYIMYNQKCTLLKIQLYLIVGGFVVMAVLLVVVCFLCYKVERRRKDEEDFVLKNKRKGYSFNVLDDETKRGDQSKISDVETIGKLSAYSHLSFIENRIENNLLDEDQKNKKDLGSFIAVTT